MTTHTNGVEPWTVTLIDTGEETMTGGRIKRVRDYIGDVVVEPAALDYIADDSTVWERDPLERLAQERGLCAYKHRGYWQYLDTLRDKFVLEEAWRSENPPWKVW